MNGRREQIERMTTGVQAGARKALLRAVPYADAPVDDGPWDADAAIARLREWAGVNVEKPSAAAWAKYGTAFALVEGAGDRFGDFKLPHHDIRGGRFVVVKRGVYAAASALQGGRGGVKAPAEDIAEAKRHIAGHYHQWDERASWEPAKAASTRCPGLAITADMGDGERPRSWIQVAKVGAWKGHPAGEFEFTPEVFEKIVANFRATQNRHLPVDFEHGSEKENADLYVHGAPATGFIVDLDNRGQDGLWGLVEWLEPGLGYVRAGRYRYFSPAITFDAHDPESGEQIGPIITSGALTNRPFLDGMAPVVAKAGGASGARSAAGVDSGAAHSATLAAQHGKERHTMDPEKLLAQAEARTEEARKDATAAKKLLAEAEAKHATADEESRAYKSFVARIAKAMGMPDDASPDEVGKKFEAAITEMRRMTDAEAKRMEAEANAEAEKMSAEGRIADSAEARGAAAKLYLTDRKLFRALYPEQTEEQQRDRRNAHLLTSRQVRPHETPPRRETAPALEDDDAYEDGVLELAARYQAADKTLAHEDAVMRASSAMLEASRSRS